MNTTTTISRHLQGARKTLAQTQARVTDLERQLREARAMELADARRREQMCAVMARMRSGQWVSGSDNRMWWHRDGQTCVELATPDELDALNSLAQQGIINTGSKRVAA